MAYNQLSGSGIKSITRSTPAALTTGVADGGTGSTTDPYYKDITITAVDLQKTIVTTDGIQGGSLVGDCVIGRLTSTTNLRVYYAVDCLYYYEIVQYN